MESQRTSSELSALQECKEFQRLLRQIQKKRIRYEQQGFCSERASQKILEKILGVAHLKQCVELQNSPDFDALRSVGLAERDILTTLRVKNAIQQYREFGDFGEIADLFLFRLDRHSSPSDYSHCSDEAEDELFRMNSLIHSELFMEGPASAVLRAQQQPQAPMLSSGTQASPSAALQQQIHNSATSFEQQNGNRVKKGRKRKSQYPFEEQEDLLSSVAALDKKRVKADNCVTTTSQQVQTTSTQQQARARPNSDSLPSARKRSNPYQNHQKNQILGDTVSKKVRNSENSNQN